MKGLLKSKLLLSLAAVLLLAGAIVLPLSGNILKSHAQGPTSTMFNVPNIDSNCNTPSFTPITTFHKGDTVSGTATLATVNADPAQEESENEPLLLQGTNVPPIPAVNDDSGSHSFSFVATGDGSLTACVGGTDGGDMDESGTVTGMVTTAPPPHSTQADLSVTKKVTSSVLPVKVGDDLLYEIDVTNHGPADATGVVLTDTLPEPVFVQFRPQASQGTCKSSLTSPTITCKLGTLANGKTAMVFITSSSTSEGKITNTVSVQADQPDPKMANNTASATTKIAPPPRPPFDLSHALEGFGVELKAGLLVIDLGECLRGDEAACTLVQSELLANHPGQTGKIAEKTVTIELEALCGFGLAFDSPEFCVPIAVHELSILLIEHHL